MSLLLDTHVLFWWVTASPALSVTARHAIEAEEENCFVSAATAFELSNKVRLGKFDAARELVERFDHVMDDNDFTALPITHVHARLAGQLAFPHRDPFDRLLVAQALTENCAIVTADAALSSLGAKTLW